MNETYGNAGERRHGSDLSTAAPMRIGGSLMPESADFVSTCSPRAAHDVLDVPCSKVFGEAIISGGSAAAISRARWHAVRGMSADGARFRRMQNLWTVKFTTCSRFPARRQWMGFWSEVSVSSMFGATVAPEYQGSVLTNRSPIPAVEAGKALASHHHLIICPGRACEAPEGRIHAAFECPRSHRYFRFRLSAVCPR